MSCIVYVSRFKNTETIHRHGSPEAFGTDGNYLCNRYVDVLLSVLPAKWSAPWILSPGCRDKAEQNAFVPPRAPVVHPVYAWHSRYTLFCVFFRPIIPGVFDVCRFFGRRTAARVCTLHTRDGLYAIRIRNHHQDSCCSLECDALKDIQCFSYILRSPFVESLPLSLPSWPCCTHVCVCMYDR